MDLGPWNDEEDNRGAEYQQNNKLAAMCRAIGSPTTRIQRDPAADEMKQRIKGLPENVFYVPPRYNEILRAWNLLFMEAGRTEPVTTCIELLVVVSCEGGPPDGRPILPTSAKPKWVLADSAFWTIAIRFLRF